MSPPPPPSSAVQTRQQLVKTFPKKTQYQQQEVSVVHTGQRSFTGLLFRFLDLEYVAI